MIKKEKMHLKYCYINNFRSIKELKVTFDNNFQILVGFNEAGKSNILKSLSLINPDILPDDIQQAVRQIIFQGKEYSQLMGIVTIPHEQLLPQIVRFEQRAR